MFFIFLLKPIFFLLRIEQVHIKLCEVLFYLKLKEYCKNRYYSEFDSEFATLLRFVSLNKHWRMCAIFFSLNRAQMKPDVQKKCTISFVHCSLKRKNNEINP